MTAPFKPIGLFIAPEVPQRDTLLVARSEPTSDFLTGPALRMVIAERHGYTPDTDLLHGEAELALAGKAYVDTYIDLELRPNHVPDSLPESWPFADLYWKEPRYNQRARALAKGIALLLAELDRNLHAQAVIDAARPLGDPGDA